MKTSLVRKSLAGLVLAGGLLAGTAGIASAETGATGTTQRPSTEQLCERAETVYERLQAADQRMHERYAKLVAARDKAAAAGKTELADKITKRLELLKQHHQKVEDVIKKIHDKAADKCSIPAAEATPLS